MQNKIFLNVVIGLAVKIVLNLSLSAVPTLNIYGSVYATLICFVVIFVLNIITLVKITGVGRKLFGTTLKITLAAVLSGVTAYLINSLSGGKILTVFAMLCAVIIYVIFIVVFKAFDLSELIKLLTGREENRDLT